MGRTKERDAEARLTPPDHEFGEPARSPREIRNQRAMMSNDGNACPQVRVRNRAFPQATTSRRTDTRRTVSWATAIIIEIAAPADRHNRTRDLGACHVSLAHFPAEIEWHSDPAKALDKRVADSSEIVSGYGRDHGIITTGQEARVSCQPLDEDRLG